MSRRERKKMPADYPLIAFRVSEEVKKELHKLIEDVQEHYNRALKSEQLPYKKNEIVVEALRRGLRQMKR
ncbi:MAG: hypothetical protein AB7G93_21465 [Bdellovibrionales bacterium]